MTVWGTHVPVSWWTAATLVVGLAVTYPTAVIVVERTGWRRGPTIVAALLLVVTLAMTAVPDPGATQPPSGLAACIPISWADIPVDIAAGGGGLSGDLMNVALYAPLAGALVLAARRVWPCCVLLVLPVLIELAQTLLPGRSCSTTDVLTNLAGIILGALGGMLVLRRQRMHETGSCPRGQEPGRP